MSNTALLEPPATVGLHGYQHALGQSYAPMELDAATPDGSPANQILVGLPMVGLYIVGIAVVWIFGKSKKSDPEVG